MTQDEIIEMAREAGWSGIYTQWAEPTGEADWSPYKVSLTVPVTIKQIEAFAKLVEEKATEKANARANASWTLMCKKMVAIEREACAKVCETGVDTEHPTVKGHIMNNFGASPILAKAIRARGEQA